VLRAISTPTGQQDFWQAQPSVILPTLAPSAAATRLMDRGRTISLAGVNTVRVPYIGASGRPPSVPLVGESQPAPNVNMITSSLVLGPVRKLLITTSLTVELEMAIGQTAEQIMSEALNIATTQQVDAALFSANPPT
jgi:hypothetical protein